jgi:hypothetical protein
MLILSPRSGLLGLGALGLSSLLWCGTSEAQAVRCVDGQGNVSYRDASAPTPGGCLPLTQQTMRDPRGESRDAAPGQIQHGPTEQKQLCMRTLTNSLFAPSTARFTLWPSGESVVVGYVEAQNRVGAYQRREVWCEFSASGTLQHAYVDYDPTVLRDNIPSK